MVDIHSHILFGIEDGPKDIGMSIEIAKQYIANGFFSVVSTPHFDPSISDLKDFTINCNNKYYELYNKFNEADLPLSITPGAEVMFYPKILDIKKINDLCIRNTNYMLIEFPWHYYPIWAEHVLFELKLQNIIPILAHPERNDEIFKNYDAFIRLVDSGLITQINAISLFNATTKRRIIKLLDDNAVTFIASDVHKPDNRLSCFAKAITILKRKIGCEKVERIIRNSELLLSNEYT